MNFCFKKQLKKISDHCIWFQIYH